MAEPCAVERGRALYAFRTELVLALPEGLRHVFYHHNYVTRENHFGHPCLHTPPAFATPRPPDLS